MIEIGFVWLLIGGELLLVLAVALAALLIMGAIRRKRDRQAALHLIKIVKDNESQRKEDTSQWLQQTHGLSGEALDHNVRDMVQAEKLLIQRVVNLYLKRDRLSLRELNIDVEAVGEPFRRLEGGGAPPVTAPPANDAAPSSGDGGNEALRAENDALKQELQVTMETMSRMLGEYASMFGSSQPGGAPGAAAAMQQSLAENAEAPAREEDPAEDPQAEELAGLDELDDLEDLDEPMGSDAPPPEAEASDETVEIDLSDDDIANLFGEEDELSAAAPEKPAQTDAEGNEMDDDLADMWADALGEQDEDEKK